jgi:hypothetical protein
MSARYFLPEHPTLTDVYSKHELRGMLQAGQLSRSDMVTDDETGIAYLLGDLLMTPFPDATIVPTRSTNSLKSQPPPATHEFRADTPLPRVERHALEEDDEQLDEEIEDEPEVPRYEKHDEEEEDEEQQQQEGDEQAAAPEASGSGMAQSTRMPVHVPQEEDRESEELLYMGHPSWLSFPKALLIVAVCIGSAVYFYQHNVNFEWITLPGSIAGLVLLFVALDRTTTTYFVTTKRVEMEFGILGRNTKEVRICDIRAIDVVQHGFGAIVGLGTVRFDSSASATPEVCFKNVRKPHDLKQLVRELQE